MHGSIGALGNRITDKLVQRSPGLQKNLGEKPTDKANFDCSKTSEAAKNPNYNIRDSSLDSNVSENDYDNS